MESAPFLSLMRCFFSYRLSYCCRKPECTLRALKLPLEAFCARISLSTYIQLDLSSEPGEYLCVLRSLCKSGEADATVA
eukprot:4262956-Pleurochrysis_carterae.AAC.2